MSNAKAVVEAAVYAALDAAIEGATVYQDVPQDAPLPVVILGDMKSYPLGGKDDPDRSVNIIIVSMVEAEERAPLLELSATFDDDDAQLGGDGATYIGTSSFTVIALTA